MGHDVTIENSVGTAFLKSRYYAVFVFLTVTQDALGLLIYAVIQHLVV